MNLIDYLPRYYEGSLTVNNLMDREGEEYQALSDAQIDVLNQYFVDSATWGLASWERVCDIPTDESKPYSQRRSLIKSKLRGYGTVTVAFIKSISETFINGECSVSQDTASYTLTITFIGTRGRPENQTDIETALRDIIPAHLGITYKFTYLSFDEIDTQQWNTIDTYVWDTLETTFFT